MEIARIDYTSVLVVMACVSFFTKAADMAGRSKLTWGGLSLGLWLGFTQSVMSGLAGGLLSQVLLLAIWFGCDVLRDRRAPAHRKRFRSPV